jgi:hypothetical protein
VFSAKENNLTYTGYQVSIYMNCDAGISRYVLPTQKGIKNANPENAQDLAIYSALQVLTEAVNKEPILKIYPAFKRFIKHVQNRSIQIPISLR